MKIVFLTDTDFRGSGYLNLSLPIMTKLSEHGHDVKCVGLQNHGEQHFFPFSILPANSLTECMGMIQNLHNQWKFDVLMVALDIPIQQNILKSMQNRPFKYVGIMPIESDPVSFQFAATLMQMDKAFIISKFGTDEAKKAGVDVAEHLVLGVDTDFWKFPTEDQRTKLRTALGFNDETFVVFTNADNQERKNYDIALKAFAEFKRLAQTENVRYAILTRWNNLVGWDLEELAMRYGVMPNLVRLDRGMLPTELWGLYAVSDAFMLLSKAEGYCALPYEQVLTKKGFVSINEITVDTKVVGHSGKFLDVTDTFIRPYSGDIINITPEYGMLGMNLTPEHPILALKRSNIKEDLFKISEIFPQWIDAQSLCEGDFVVFPHHIIRDEYVSSIDVSKYLDDVVLENSLVFSKTKNQFQNNLKNARSYIPRNVDVNDDFMTFLGYYISEGCYSRNGIKFAFHSEEVNLHKEVEKSLSVFEDSYYIRTSFHDRHRCLLHIQGVGTKLLAQLVSNLCGSESHTKHLPNFVWQQPDRLKWKLIRSMFLGDGTYNAKAKQKVLRYSTVSVILARELQSLLLSLGVVSSLKSRNGKLEYVISIYEQNLNKVPFMKDFDPDFSYQEYPHLKHSARYIETKDYIAIPIKSIWTSYYRGEVYNLEIETDNSYQLSGGLVHNCMPLVEAMGVGVPCLGTNCTAIQDHLSDNRGYLVDYNYVHTDPFGNANRYWANPKHAAEQLKYLFDMKQLGKYGVGVQQVIQNARKYVEANTWDNCVDQIERYLETVNEQKV